LSSLGIRKNLPVRYTENSRIHTSPNRALPALRGGIKMKKEPKAVTELRSQLKKREQVQVVVKFSGLRWMILFFVVAAISFAAGRIWSNHIAALVISNVLSIWMMIDAAQVLVSSQGSAALLTNRRIFGTSSSRPFNISYSSIVGIHPIRGGIFIDTGDPHSSTVLKNVQNKKEILKILETTCSGKLALH
jgi:hypothetical protein